MVALVTYNPFFSYLPGTTIQLLGEEVLLLSETFASPRKGPESVTRDDRHFLLLLEHIDRIEYVAVFAGKKDSGALEIIQLFHDTFWHCKEKLYFKLCDHDKEEKVALLRSLGFEDTQWGTFGDNWSQCRESEELIGAVYGHIARTKTVVA